LREIVKNGYDGYLALVRLCHLTWTGV